MEFSDARDYFDLSLAQGAVGVAREAVRISTNYEAQVKSAVEAGIAFKGDLLRVSVQADRNRLALRQASEQQRVAAARLAQTLHLDPAVELVARDTDLAPITLIETNATLKALVQLQSQSEQISMARRGLTAAEEGLRLAQQRQEFGVGVVLENIQSEQDLTRTRSDYLKAIAEFNKAQYGLSKAVGVLPMSQ